MKVYAAWVSWTLAPSRCKLYNYSRPHMFFLIPGFILAWRHNPLQPVCRELNSDPFAFLKNHSSKSRTDFSHFSNHGTNFHLAKPTVLDVSETFLKIVRTYQKIDFKKWPFLYCFRKTPSKLAFFSRKIVKYDLNIFKTFLRNCKSYQVRQVFKKPAFPWLLTCPRAYTPSPPFVSEQCLVGKHQTALNSVTNWLDHFSIWIPGAEPDFPKSCIITQEMG